MLFPLDISLIPQSLLDTDHVLIPLLDVSTVKFAESMLLLLLLSRFSHVQLCATP